MKLKMKLPKNLTQKQWMIVAGSVAAVILLTGILCFTLIPKRNDQPPTETEPDNQATVSVSDIQVEEPEKSDDTAADTTLDTEVSDGDATAEKLPDGANVLKPDEKAEPDESQQTGEKADTAAQPVTPTPLPEENENSGGGIIIGGGEQPKPYSCGAEGHLCSGPETHSFILNLELEGCEYCGSHNCPSFYATNEWGNTRYTPSKCPKYDIKKDPVYYCQECGKECGSGSPDKCIQFVNSDNCPNCGEWVEGWTCHSCK